MTGPADAATTPGPARVVLVPGVLALLPDYAGQEDPVAELRAACRAAVSALGADVTVVADPQGDRVARHLLEDTADERADRGGEGSAYASLLVVGNGSACRTEKAPGHLDERAAAFDEALRSWLTGEPGATAPDAALARELLAAVDGLLELAGRLPDWPGGWPAPEAAYEDDPFGVQYWVMGWSRRPA